MSKTLVRIHLTRVLRHFDIKSFYVTPTICIVGTEYQIMIHTDVEALISVRVGENTYYNHSNGIRISTPGMHRFRIPQEELDRACEYTVITEKMIERTPYFPKSDSPVEETYKFTPITKTEDINIYHLADVHGEKDKAIAAVKFSGRTPDLLIMNGDISSTSDTFEDIILCYKIASEVTGGSIPCIISRGNHDLRGAGAENLAKNMPGEYGNSYYTFRAGCIWGILVDAGEDKMDFNAEYGSTVACHPFRLEQQKMIEKTIKNAIGEYEADGVKYRMVISHIPFTFRKRLSVFDIERELYTNWSELLRENVKPDFMLCGHTHNALISEPGSEMDDLGHPCTVIVGSDVKKDDDGNVTFTGTNINLQQGYATVSFNTEKEVTGEAVVKFQGA